MIHVFFTHLSTAVVKPISFCLSPETKFSTCYLMLGQGPCEQCSDPDAKGTIITPFHVSSSEQQQKEKLNDIWNKKVDGTFSAIPSMEDLNNSASSFLVFLLSL